MSQDAVAATRAAVESLTAAAGRVAAEFGETLGVKRLLSDVARLKDDLVELGDPKPGHRPSSAEGIVEMDDTPYDESMWLDAESESQRAL